jgi:hypothetical protein
MQLNLFLPITKVDAAKRLVYGTIAEEVVDKSDEILDYASSKPLFEAWSGAVAKATDGRSVGNVRAMHGKVAAGKLTEIAFDDEARRIEACAKVVDDDEWAKVEQGVYTGFSIGGKYVKRWKDAGNAGVTRYTAEPAEVSLVDNPCMPTATFSMIKADGVVEKRHFKPKGAGPTAPLRNADVVAKAQALAKSAGAASKWHNFVEQARTELLAAAAEPVLAKLGARNSAADQARLQQAHDLLCEAGATCPPQQATTTDTIEQVASGELAKLAAENAGLREAVTAAVPLIDELRARIEKLENQPMPGGPARTDSYRVVDKAADDARAAAGMLDELVKSNPDLIAAAAIKMAQRQPLKLGQPG